MSKVIYIEGSREMDNGDLRKAFAKLFEKELSGSMPHVVMGNGKDQTIDKFHSTPLGKDECRFLLVDSDGPMEDKSIVCAGFNQMKPNRKQNCSVNNTFFMIQEAEAWILSQPEVLKQHGIKVQKLPKRNVMEINKPSLFLGSLYKASGADYHKVRDFSRIVPELNTTILKKDFQEFADLVNALKQLNVG